MRSLLLFTLVFLGSGCNFLPQSLPGSGIIKQEARAVGDFNKVSFGGSADIKIVAGAAEPSCSIQCDDNLLSFISTEVVDKELRIRLNGSSKISPTKGLQVEISLPDLDALNLAGDTTTSVTGLTPAMFDVHLSGSHDLQCEGLADKVHFAVAGTCNIKAAKLQSKSTSINLSGSGSVEIQASEKLDVKIAGSGTVRYVGEPAITQSIAGVGKIEKME